MKQAIFFLLAAFFISSCSGDGLIDERFLTKNYDIQSQALDLGDLNLTTVPDFNQFGTGSDFFSARSLNLSQNNIEFIDSSYLSRFSELRDISLAFNRLQVVRDLGVDLDILNLSNNEIEVLEFSSGSLIKELDVSWNHLNFGADIQRLPTTVTRLDLSDNQLQNIDGIGKLTRLNYLDLSNNKLSDGDMKELSQQKKLQYLELIGNQDISEARIEKMEKHNEKYIEKQNEKASTKDPVTKTGAQ